MQLSCQTLRPFRAVEVINTQLPGKSNKNEGVGLQVWFQKGHLGSGLGLGEDCAGTPEPPPAHPWEKEHSKGSAGQTKLKYSDPIQGEE